MVDRNLDRKRQKLSEQSEHIQSLRASENKLNSQKLQLEKGLQQRTRLEDNKLTLESSNENLVHEIKVFLSELWNYTVGLGICIDLWVSMSKYV